MKILWFLIVTCKEMMIKWRIILTYLQTPSRQSETSKPIDKQYCDAVVNFLLRIACHVGSHIAFIDEKLIIMNLKSPFIKKTSRQHTSAYNLWSSLNISQVYFMYLSKW